MVASGKKLGELLRDRQLISDAALQDAITEQRSTAMMLGELLLDRELVPKDELVRILEELTRSEYVDLTQLEPDPELLKLVPRATALRHSALPLYRDKRGLVVAMAEPQNLTALDNLRFLLGTDICPRLGFRSEIITAIEAFYAQAASTATDLGLYDQEIADLEFISASSNERNQAAVREFQAALRGDRTPAVRVFSAILGSAAAKKASDIHLEPLDVGIIVRIRVDGVLRELIRIPHEIRNQLISRVKILSDMDIAERRVPQDGRFLAKIKDRHLDIRVSTLPTQYGEKIVLRLLDSLAAKVPFSQLGFSPEADEALSREIQSPQGMILVTGPTGSGKSTTLYSALNLIRSSRVNVVTIEDPIEYVLEGINQVQVNPKAGRTFSGCLRSMLRQDPNVIMLGEIRDGETAEIALTAAQTGHLVLSTLHTNDTVSAITRLLDLNIASFLISSSVSVILAQRLVRKLCSCRQVAPASKAYRTRLEALGVADAGTEMYVAVGCDRCEEGYSGRVGIYELLVMDEQLKAAVRAGSRDDELRAIACDNGMKLLQQDALEKVLAGVTTLDEVQRVVPFTRMTALACSACGRALAPTFLYCPYCATAIHRRKNVASMRQHHRQSQEQV